METFEIIINQESFKISRKNTDNQVFNIFNHTTCHIIKKNRSGKWEKVVHRFGSDILPLKEIGEAIDRYYTQNEQHENLIQA
ncbi:hypothetical protein BH09BAC6_BH09BAC6_10950 [soil metagenome]|jgi:hypothetical protein